MLSRRANARQVCPEVCPLGVWKRFSRFLADSGKWLKLEVLRNPQQYRNMLIPRAAMASNQ